MRAILASRADNSIAGHYNLGQDLVKQYVERTAGGDATDSHRWQVFSGLLASPRLPSELAAREPLGALSSR